MNNDKENNSPKASNYDGQKNSSQASAHDETKQLSAASSPFNSFIVEYDIGMINLNPQSPKENNKLSMSGELGQPKSVFNSKQAMIPPQAQHMGEYDPNRIPGSAFGTKNGTVDWSTASNESLFSIYMGNASFNRDHPAFFLKSQELPKFDDHAMNHSSRLPQVSANTNINGKQDHLLCTLEEPKKEASTRAQERLSSESSSTPRYSTGSNAGVSAFSFPILDNADIRYSLGKLSPEEINKQSSYLETPKVGENNNAVNFPVSAAASTPTAKTTNLSPFSCCRG